MAKKSAISRNKSLEIREYKAANSSASPKEIAAALHSSGLAVSAQFVSTVLSNAKKKNGAVGKRGPKPGRKAATLNASSELSQLIQAKKLVDQLGGIEAAKSAINTLAQILG
jgi:hypothetical protein